MKVIIDTHALLWLSEQPPRLPMRAKSALDDQKNEVFVSIASAWELAIKASLGKLTVEPTVQEFMARALSVGNIQLLQITMEHINRVQLLPMHHKDPFDRLLIAQAMVEDATLVSGDPAIDRYGVNRVW